MIRISASSHYLHAMQEGDTLPKLDDLLRPLLREPIRRIDRFIQLALLGSLQCAQSRALEPDAGIYVGSGTGPVGNNIIVQETLIKAHLLPKPFHFVNTLGSSTGYYICKNLQLSGPSLFISRHRDSLRATLACALADLQSGAVRQALVGIVEECALPLAEHLKRLDRPAKTPLAEGSHWILLEADTTLPGRNLQVSHFDALDALKHSLSSTMKAEDCLALSPELDAAQELTMFQRYPYEPTFHDSQDAAILTEFVRGGQPGRLFLTAGNEISGWSLIEVGARSE